MRHLLPPRVILSLALLTIIAGFRAPSVQAEDMTVDQIVETLKASIRDKNDPMRNRMFFKLRALGSKAVPALTDLLKSPEPGISEYSAFTLGWIADVSSIRPLLSFLDAGNASQKRHALQALGNMAWGTDEKVRKEIHKQAVPAMIPHLKSTDLTVVRDAAYGLGLAGDTKAIEALQPLTSHKDTVVSFLAKEAIERIQSVNKE